MSEHPPKKPYTLREATLIIDNHEERLARLDPMWPYIRVVRRTYHIVLWGLPTLIVAILTTSTNETPIGRLMHFFIPALFN